MRVDALIVDQECRVVEAMADFSRLPFFNGHREVNSDVAPLGQEVNSDPFDNVNFLLKPGTHLHWALPDALTRGLHEEDGIHFPRVPNRWLVTRRDGESVIQSWIVESDYLHPVDGLRRTDAISYPVRPQRHDRNRQPFRYLGRSLTLDQWLAGDPSADYLDQPLTAVGYGDPSFAAFYPNCHSVFGFHDANCTEATTYAVYGWYANSDHDFLAHYRAMVRRSLGRRAHTDELRDRLCHDFRWAIDLERGTALPDVMLCTGQVSTEHTRLGDQEVAEKELTFRAMLGSSTTDALAAFLAEAGKGEGNAISMRNLLKSIQLAPQIGHRTLDAGLKFQEARHEKEFHAVPSGSLWTIVPAVRSEAATAGETEQVTLPTALAHELHELNRLQMQSDSTRHDLQSTQEHLFADWCKLMLCTYPPEATREIYPDPDTVMDWIDENVLASVNALQEELKQCQTLIDTQQTVVQEMLNDSAGEFILQRKGSSRYWQPTEPAIVLDGPGIRPTDRHGMTSKLHEERFLSCPCIVLDRNRLPGHILQTEMPSNDGPVGDDRQFINPTIHEPTSAPWNPFLLEWEVDYDALRLGSEEGNAAIHPPDSIVRAYQLDDLDVDLSPREENTQDEIARISVPDIITGRSLLTPHAAIHFREALGDHIWRMLKECNCWKAGTPPDTERRAKLLELLGDKNLVDVAKLPRDLEVLITIFETLQTVSFLGQSLSGFNAALLTRRQAYQLPVKDPLGFSDYKQFSEDVAEAVGRQGLASPQPELDFHPIRAGRISLRRLRLIDTFGQYVDRVGFWSVERGKDWPEELDGQLTLPPRLVQPARLNFRFRSADLDEVEMNDHPATTPICGWFMTNHLDQSLMVYNNQGKAIGSITAAPDSLDPAKATWMPAPGADLSRTWTSIENRYLRNCVQFLLRQGPEFIAEFIITIDESKRFIEPESVVHHPYQTVLFGQPVALVRATLSLELKGLPARDQSWKTFWQELSEGAPQSADFVKMRFPVRLGEFRQLNDGLVGYWVETADNGFLNDRFFAPQLDENDQAGVSGNVLPAMRRHTANLNIAIDDPPQSLLMLMDPCGSVHATTGLLPTKELRLPADQFSDLLKSLEVMFLSSPLLTDAEQLRLNLPASPHITWTWIEKSSETWTQLSGEQITSSDASARFHGRQMIREGWLRFTHDDESEN
jgi:hypothetical protein